MSLGLHKEELVTSLALLDFEFDLIAVPETKINANVSPIHDLSLTGYKYFHTPTESEKEGSLSMLRGILISKDDMVLRKKCIKHVNLSLSS